MTTYNWPILALWLVFVAYWGISAISAKRRVGPRPWRTEIAVRLIIIILVIVALRVPAARRVLSEAHGYAARNTLLDAIGALICALGLGLAFVARHYIGRNWGMPMSRKEDPELVTTGPYALIRHPIYAGMLLAMLGTAIAESVVWVLPLVVFGAYFIYSARREEQLMLEQFPTQYPAYMKRTKMLVPFVV